MGGQDIRRREAPNLKKGKENYLKLYLVKFGKIKLEITNIWEGLNL